MPSLYVYTMYTLLITQSPARLEGGSFKKRENIEPIEMRRSCFDLTYFCEWFLESMSFALPLHFSIEVSTFLSHFHWNIYCLITLVLKSLLSHHSYWSLHFLTTFLLKCLLSFHFSNEITTTFSLPCYWNVYFLFTFLLKYLLSQHVSIQVCTFSALFYCNLFFSLFFSIEIKAMMQLLQLFHNIGLSFGMRWGEQAHLCRTLSTSYYRTHLARPQPLDVLADSQLGKELPRTKPQRLGPAPCPGEDRKPNPGARLRDFFFKVVVVVLVVVVVVVVVVPSPGRTVGPPFSWALETDCRQRQRCCRRWWLVRGRSQCSASWGLDLFSGTFTSVASAGMSSGCLATGKNGVSPQSQPGGLAARDRGSWQGPLQKPQRRKRKRMSNNLGGSCWRTSS